MEKVNVVVKKWGNSFGIILPKDLIESQELKEGSNIEVVIQPKNITKVKDIFGIMKGKLKRDTAEVLKEVDKELWGEN